MWLYGFFLYGTLLLSAVVTAITLRHFDLRPAEPWRTILSAVALAAGLMWAAGAAQDAVVLHLVSSGRAEPSNLVYAALAGTTEEAAKLLAVATICTLFRRYFEEYSDGVFYGALAGLGAAVTESIHVLGWPQHLAFLPIQEPVRIAGHLVMGTITCAPLGLLAVRDSRWRWSVPLFYLLGAALHTLWDWTAYETADAFRAHGVLRWHHSAISIAVMLTGLTGFRLLVRYAAVLQRARPVASAET